MNSTRGEKDDRGFSLVEIIVVIAIMAILIGVLAPAYFRYVEKSRKQRDESAADEIEHAAGIIVFSGTYELEEEEVLVTFSQAGIQVVSSNAGTALEAELKGVFGDDLSTITPESRTYKDKTYKIEIVASDEEYGSPEIVGAWTDET